MPYVDLPGSRSTQRGVHHTSEPIPIRTCHGKYAYHRPLLLPLPLHAAIEKGRENNPPVYRVRTYEYTSLQLARPVRARVPCPTKIYVPERNKTKGVTTKQKAVPALSTEPRSWCSELSAKRHRSIMAPAIHELHWLAMIFLLCTSNISASCVWPVATQAEVAAAPHHALRLSLVSTLYLALFLLSAFLL